MTDELDYYRAKYPNYEITYNDNLYTLRCLICFYDYDVKRLSDIKEQCEYYGKYHAAIIGLKKTKYDIIYVDYYSCKLYCSICNWKFTIYTIDIVDGQLGCLCNIVFPTLRKMKQYMSMFKHKLLYYNNDNGYTILQCYKCDDKIIINNATETLRTREHIPLYPGNIVYTAIGNHKCTVEN